jgi:hypothetical protein
MRERTVSPRWLVTVTCSSTKPWALRRGCSRLAEMQAVTVIVSPMNTGFTNLILS